MSSKPLKNSKGVNKPFRSPFNTFILNDSKRTANVHTPESSKSEPLRNSLMKRLIFEDTPPRKSLCLNTEDDQQIREEKEILYQSDLESLQRRVQQKEESLAILKTKQLHRKKNKAMDLESAIKIWTEGCQTALEDYQAYQQERNGRTVSMSDIFSVFNINPEIVCYSVDDDAFH